MSALKAITIIGPLWNNPDVQPCQYFYAQDVQYLLIITRLNY